MIDVDMRGGKGKKRGEWMRGGRGGERREERGGREKRERGDAYRRKIDERGRGEEE